MKGDFHLYESPEYKLFLSSIEFKSAIMSWATWSNEYRCNPQK